MRSMFKVFQIGFCAAALSACSGGELPPSEPQAQDLGEAVAQEQAPLAQRAAGYSIFNSRLKITTVKAQFSGLAP